MDKADDRGAQIAREVAQLGAQVRSLRLAVLRVPAILAVALIVAGSLLPAWSETVDDEPQTRRVLIVGFQALSEPGGGFGVAAGIGFLGLLVILLLLCGVLVNSVIAGQGRAEHARVRGLIGALAAVGAVVATLFSLAGWGSDEPDVSGGFGPVVLLAGVIVGVLVVGHRPWHDLWLDQG